MHTPSDVLGPSGSLASLDAVTYEILRHRLHQVTRDAALTLERVGGTVNTTQMKDYIAAIYDRYGRILSAGDTVIPFHVACAGRAVQDIMARFRMRGGGVCAGDMFLVNDPYTAAIHQSDVYLISPVHVGDEVVAWSATFVHVMDIGAQSPGGNSPAGTSIFHEGVRTAGLKIVDRGVLREDVFDTFVNMTRAPVMVGLDIRCQIAANNVARDRIMAISREHGVEAIDAVAERSISETREILARRLAGIPDGSWVETAAIEAGGRWEVHLCLEKTGSDLSFDFTGTDRQAPIGINLPLHATIGSCYEAVIRVLGFDLPKNQGALECFSVEAPHGTVVNPEYPAPVSLNTSSGASVVRYLAKTCAGAMAAGSEEWWTEAMTQDVGGRFLRHAGVNQRGDYYVSTLTSIDGNGARATRDGNESGGPLTCHNIEWVERNFPVLHLFRRHIVDGGGAGVFRGGAGEETAYVLRGAPEGCIDVVALGVAGLGNSGQGLFGGYPGKPSGLAIIRDSNILQLLGAGTSPVDLGDMGGRWEILGYAHTTLSSGDVLYLRGISGGGYGDPLEREVDAVFRDVSRGLITREAGDLIYGASRGDDNITEANRSRIRRSRLGTAEPSRRREQRRGGRRLQYGLRLWEDHDVTAVYCDRCHYVIARNRDEWVDGCVEFQSSYPLEDPFIRAFASSYALTHYCCPGCGRAVLVRWMPIEGDE